MLLRVSKDLHRNQISSSEIYLSADREKRVNYESALSASVTTSVLSGDQRRLRG